MVLPIDTQIQGYEANLTQKREELDRLEKEIAREKETGKEESGFQKTTRRDYRNRIQKLDRLITDLKARRNEIASLPEEKQPEAIKGRAAMLQRIRTESFVQSQAQEAARKAAKKSEAQRLQENVSVTELPPQSPSGPTLKEQRIATGGVVDVQKDQTIGQAFSTIKLNIQRGGLWEGIKSAPTLLYNAATNPNERAQAERQKFNTDVSNLEQGRIVYGPSNVPIPNIDLSNYRSPSGQSIKVQGQGSQTQNLQDNSFLQNTNFGGRIEGTTSEISFSPISDEELLMNAKLGDDASLQAYVNIQNKNLEIKAREIATREYNKDIQNVNIIKNQIQQRINRGEISVEQGNKELKDYTSSLDEARINKVQSEIQPEIKDLQKEVDSAAKKGKVSKIVIKTGEAFAIGAVTGGLYGAAPRAVKLGADVAFGTLAAYEVSNLAQDVGAGEAGALDVVGFGLTTGAAITGFAAGAKVTGSARTSETQNKLDLAIKNSDIVVKTEGIIKETSLSKLDIPSLDKVKLEAQVNAGNSVRKIDVKIRPRSTAEQELIETELPYRNIEFVEVTNQFGNVIDRIAIGKVKLEGKSGKVFKQDIISGTEAYIGEGGVIEGTTLTAIGKGGKGIEKAILTTEKTRGEVFPLAKRGAVRVVKTSTGVKLVEALERKGRPLTQAELKDLVLRGQGEEGTIQLSESEFMEVQKRARFRVEALIANNKAVVKTEDVRVGRGSGISTSVLEVPKAKKTFKGTSFEKTFGEPRKAVGDVLSDIGRQVKEKTSGFKQNVELKVKDFMQAVRNKPADVEAGVRESLSRGVRDVIVPESPRTAVIPKSNQAKISNLDVLTADRPSLRFESLIKQLNLQNVGSIESQAQNVSQSLQLENQNLQMPSETFTGPNFTYPNIDIPMGFPFRRGTEAGLRKLSFDIGKRVKRTSQFTASLSAAVGGVGVEVDEKRLDKTLKKLSEKTFTGFETRPLIVVRPNKKKKSKKR